MVARPDVEEDLAHARDLADAAFAPNTRRAYRTDIADWKRYAESVKASFVPADPVVVAMYVSHMDQKRGLSPGTIRRRCAAITFLHRERGLPNPLDDKGIKRVLKGLVRERNIAPKRKTPLSAEIVRRIALAPTTSVRDRALVITGFVSGLRRSELADLTWAEVEEHPEGIILRIARSKTDKEGRGQVVALPRSSDLRTCPVQSLLAWKNRSTKERVFPLSAQAIADVVKRCVEKIGEISTNYSGHSMRAGLATNAAREGVSLGESMQATRHKSADVAAQYVRVASAFENRAHRAAVDALARPSKKERP